VQLLSIPSHAYQLKMQKFVRGVFIVPGAGLTVTTGDLGLVVVTELGLSTGATHSTQIAVHKVHAYSNKSTQAAGTDTGSTDLSVVSRNLSTGAVWAQFDDAATVSGVASIRFDYPVNDRPTFDLGAAAQPLLVLNSTDVSGVNTLPVTVDFLVDVTRTLVVPFGLLMRQLALGTPCAPVDYETDIAQLTKPIDNLEPVGFSSSGKSSSEAGSSPRVKEEV
jgi:hypothetical protein